MSKYEVGQSAMIWVAIAFILGALADSQVKHSGENFYAAWAAFVGSAVVLWLGVKLFMWLVEKQEGER